MSTVLFEETLSSLGFTDCSFVLIESGGKVTLGTDPDKLENIAKSDKASLPALLKMKFRIGGREEPIVLFLKDGPLYFDGRSSAVEANG